MTENAAAGTPAWSSAARVAALACAVACAGCGGTVMTGSLLAEAPPAAELASLSPQYRAGVMVRVPHINGKLQDGLPAFVDSREAAEGCGWVDGLARVAFLPDPLPEGPGVKAIVNLAATGGGGRSPGRPGQTWWLDSGAATSYAPGLTLEGMLGARQGSSFHVPLRGALGLLDCWVIGESFSYRDKLYATAEIYIDDPRGGSAKPDRVLVLAERAGNGAWVERNPGKPFSVRGRLYTLAEADRAAGSLTSFRAEDWKADVDDVIANRLSVVRQMMGEKESIRFGNDLLLSWKTKGLPGRLRDSDVGSLQDFSIALEKAVLRADMDGRKWKDAAQAKIAQGSDPSGDREMSLLANQRKALLVAILRATKQAIQVKSRR